MVEARPALKRYAGESRSSQGEFDTAEPISSSVPAKAGLCSIGASFFGEGSETDQPDTAPEHLLLTSDGEDHPFPICPSLRPTSSFDQVRNPFWLSNRALLLNRHLTNLPFSVRRINRLTKFGFAHTIRGWTCLRYLRLRFRDHTIKGRQGL